MKYISICSGICAATVAWLPLNWTPLAFAEIEGFPSAVLAHRWPHIPNLGDLRGFQDWPEELLAEVEALVGGTPCQAFSVAGLRGSLADDRGNLTLIYVELIARIDAIRARYGRPPVICLWENVPGVLSTGDNAYGCFLAALAGERLPLEPPGGKWTHAGYVRGPLRSIAWRCLDAQYLGVPQRRERVFALAGSGGFRPEEILFESEGLRRDSPPSREAREGLAGTLTGRSGNGSRPAGGNGNLVTHALRGEGFDASEDGAGRGIPLVAASLDASFGKLQGCSGQDLNHGHSHLVPTAGPAGAVCAKWAKGTGGPSGDECQNLVAVHSTGDGYWREGIGTLRAREQDSHENLIAFDCKASGQNGFGVGEVSPTLRSMGHKDSHSNAGGQVAIAFNLRGREGGAMPEVDPDGLACQRAAAAGSSRSYVAGPALAVRRLTPTECERLQGFPDGHTLIPWRGKPADQCPDGPRYKALGNSMAVPVMAWIGRRIAAAEALSQSSPAEAA